MLTVTTDQSEGISGADIPEQDVKKCVQAPPPCLSPAPARFLHLFLLNDFLPPSPNLEHAGHSGPWNQELKLDLWEVPNPRSLLPGIFLSLFTSRKALETTKISTYIDIPLIHDF